MRRCIRQCARCARHRAQDRGAPTAAVWRRRGRAKGGRRGRVRSTETNTLVRVGGKLTDGTALRAVEVLAPYTTGGAGMRCIAFAGLRSCEQDALSIKKRGVREMLASEEGAWLGPRVGSRFCLARRTRRPSRRRASGRRWPARRGRRRRGCHTGWSRCRRTWMCLLSGAEQGSMSRLHPPTAAVGSVGTSAPCTAQLHACDRHQSMRALRMNSTKAKVK